MENIDVVQATPCTPTQRRAYLKNLVSFGLRSPRSCVRYLKLKQESERVEPLLFFELLRVQMGHNRHLLDDVDPLDPKAVLAFIDEIRSSVLDHEDLS